MCQVSDIPTDIRDAVFHRYVLAQTSRLPKGPLHPTLRRWYWNCLALDLAIQDFVAMAKVGSTVPLYELERYHALLRGLVEQWDVPIQDNFADLSAPIAKYRISRNEATRTVATTSD